jgi:hypothetical protein
MDNHFASKRYLAYYMRPDTLKGLARLCVAQALDRYKPGSLDFACPTILCAYAVEDRRADVATGVKLGGLWSLGRT